MKPRPFWRQKVLFETEKMTVNAKRIALQSMAAARHFESSNTDFGRI